MKKISSLFFFLIIFKVSFSQVPAQQWLSKYNGKGDLSDKFNAIKIDLSGNVFLTGYTVNSGNKKDFLTVKLSPAGDTLWTRTLAGLGGSDDEGLDIAIDLSGNVYVTGYSKGNTSNDDYQTIKYNSTGDLLWSATYNYSANQDDQANSIGIDGAGNVYITGKSDSDATEAVINDDYATVKYTSTGLQYWVVRYNGAGNATDRAVKLAVTNAGIVYVTGRSDNGIDDDFVSIKYSTSGLQQWVRIFDTGDNDKAETMTIDNSENLYITGRSNNGSDDDFSTIKYSSSGSELWPGGVIYDGTGTNDDKPTAIAVDASGNVYVTGRSDRDNSLAINYDFATIKYNSTGTQIWVSTYNGVGNGNDTPSGIIVDGTGKVVVCGQSDSDASVTVTNNDCAVISYTSSGVQSWLMTYNGTSNLSDGGNDIAVDLSGNLFVAGASDNTGTQKDGLVIKYTTSGTQTWGKNFNGTGDNSDNVNKIVVDASGNSYLAGYTYNASSERDLLVVKINPIGDTLWTRKYNGSSNNSDEAIDIFVDATGNVIITGYCKESVSGYNFITSKYDPTGTLLWSTQYNNILVNGYDKASSLTVDAAGNIYVTGYSYGTAIGNEDFVTIKYNSAGIQLWATRYNGTGNGTDIPVQIEINGTDSYITGESFNGTGDQIVTIKYNSSGIQQWAAIYSNALIDKPSALSVDAIGNTFVTGRTGNGIDDNYITIKYNTSGVQQWATVYTSGTGIDRASALVIDYLGSVIVTGKSSNGTTDNFATVKYNSSGVQQWVSTFDGIANGNDVATDIKIDMVGDIIVAGEADNGTLLNPNIDFTFIKYHADGAEVWNKSYDGADNLTDGINTFAIDAANNIYVSGNSSLTAEQKNIVTIKYDSPVGLDELELADNNSQAFPNPFSLCTTISISSDINMDENISFQLFDILGNKVRVIDEIVDYATKFSRDNLANGVYIYKLIQGGKVISTKKLIIQ